MVVSKQAPKYIAAIQCVEAETKYLQISADYYLKILENEIQYDFSTKIKKKKEITQG